jgi:hypothetical protein
MRWQVSNRFEREAVAIADRHYNRQKPGTNQFVPPGSCFVLRGVQVPMLWVSLWPRAEFVAHSWAGAWVNSLFRKECPGHASDDIRDAIAATLCKWPWPPRLGMVTFINPKHVKPIMQRGRPVWGYSYIKAGFRFVGYTQGGLIALQMLPEDPAPEPAINFQLQLFGVP